MRTRTTTILEATAVPVKDHHHEVGAGGQCEIETPMMRGAVATGDMIMKVKYVTKRVAHAAGKTASSMPKPLYGESENGMHFHQQLFKEGTKVFCDPNGYGNLSQDGLHPIEGLLLRGRAILAVTIRPQASAGAWSQDMKRRRTPFSAWETAAQPCASQSTQTSERPLASSFARLTRPETGGA